MKPSEQATCSERLRGEWLASTGLLTSGRAELAVLDECTRIERLAEDHVIMLSTEASALGVLELRQLVTRLQSARAASLRLQARAMNSSALVTVG